MHFGGMVEQLFFELLLSHLLFLNFESFGTLRKSQGKCRVDILILLPLDLKVIWTKVEDLSEHSQSKAFALGHRDTLLHLFQRDPVPMSGTEVIECWVQELLHFHQGTILLWEHKLVRNLHELLWSSFRNFQSRYQVLGGRWVRLDSDHIICIFLNWFLLGH